MITTKSLITEETNLLVLQKSEKLQTQVKQCKLIIERRMQHCGMHSHTSEVENSYHYIVRGFNAEECEKVHNTRVLELYPESLLSELQLNSTSRGEFPVVGRVWGTSCKGGVYTAQGRTWEDVIVFYKYEITLQDYAAEVNTEANIIKLRRGLNCEYSKGHCLDSEEGYISWNINKNEKCENNDFEVVYSGKANRTILDPKDESLGTDTRLYTAYGHGIVFSIRTQEQTKICGYNGYTTDHNRVVVIELNNNFHPFTRHVKDGINLDLITYFNSKLSFLEYHNEEQMSKLYAHMMNEICKIDKSLLETNLVMARINPNEFAERITGRPGHTAVVTGEVIHTIGCEAVFVKPAPQNRCYQEIPVTYNGELYYVAPVTHIIQRHGTEIDCAPYLEAKYKIGSRWYTIDNAVRETTHPSVLGSEVKADWSYISLPELMNTGLYDKSSFDKMRNMIYEQSDRRSVSTVFHRMVEGKQPDQQGYNMVKIFDEHEIHSLMTSYWNKFLNWSNTLGNIASTVFGLYIIGRVLKFFIDTVVHGRILYDIYGISWRLVASCWDSLTNLLSHNYQKRNVEELRTLETKEPTAPDCTQMQPLLNIQSREKQTVGINTVDHEIDTTLTLDEHLQACNVKIPTYHKQNRRM